MTALLAIAVTQLYEKEPTIGFAREVAQAPPLLATQKSKFKVSIFNGTKKSIKVPSEKCSSGYEMISFQLISPAGRDYDITRKPKPWIGNVQIPEEIPSTGLVIRKINFGDGTWEGFPSYIPGSGDGWKIRVKAHVEDSKFFRDNGFWTGDMESKFTPATRKD